ncbi:ABC transporter substrate-binding protein [Georgenia yuyongxinii]
MSSHEPIKALIPREMLGRGVGRRAFLGGAGALSLTAFLAACSGNGSAGSSDGSGGGGGSKTLNMYSWAGYNDPAVIEDFTSRSGISITVDSYGSNPELAAKLNAARGTSGYDICVPTHSYVKQLAEQGLIQELDHSRLPNFANLDPGVSDTSFDPGSKYSVCKAWGSTGFVYDTTVIQRELTSWADFLDAAQNEASGSVSLMEDQKECMFIYMFANGLPPNTTDQAHLDAYREYFLANVAPHVQAFASATNASVANNERALIHCWNGDARLGIMSNADPERYRWVWPSEGANIWQDNYSIVEGAQNLDAAYEFINDQLDPDISLQELSYLGYNTGVAGIEDAAIEAGVERPEMIFIDAERMKKLKYSEITEVDQFIISTFDEIRAAAGQA